MENSRSVSPTSASTCGHHSPRATDNNPYKQFLDESLLDVPDVEIELDRYLRQPRLTDDEAKKSIDQWKGQRTEYPCLRRFALDVHSIPAMGSEPERTFSLGKLVMTSQHQSISDKTLDQQICLKSWQ